MMRNENSNSSKRCAKSLFSVQHTVLKQAIANMIKTYTSEEISWKPGSLFKAKLGRVLSICTKVKNKTYSVRFKSSTDIATNSMDTCVLLRGL